MERPAITVAERSHAVAALCAAAVSRLSLIDHDCCCGEQEGDF
jgi:hypothetical protein